MNTELRIKEAVNLIQITHDGVDFKKHPIKEDVIIGHYYEDGTPFEITTPPELRNVILFSLQRAVLQEQVEKLTAKIRKVNQL
jgi:hypothetical protein